MNISKSLEHTRQGPILGEIVSWNLYKIETPQEDFYTKYESLELPEHCWFQKRDRSALTKSLKVMEKDNLILKVFEDDHKIKYKILMEEADVENEDINLRRKDYVTYDKNTKKISLKTENQVRTEELNQLFEKYQNLITGYEISKIFVRLCTDIGVTVGGGGNYFIPKNYLERVDKMERLIEGTKGSVLRLGIADSKAYKESVKKVVMEDLLGSVRKIKRDIKDLRSKSTEEPVRDFIIERRLTKIDRFSSKIGNFKSLGIDEQTIFGETKKCTRALRKLGVVTTEKEGERGAA